MTWTRHHVAVSESCTRSHAQSSHLTECIRAFLRNSYNDALQADRDQMYGSVVSWGLGCIVFPLCLGVFQVGVFKPFSLTASHVLAPALGLCSVAASGVAASLTVLVSYSNYHGESVYRDLDVRLSDVVCYGLGTATVFKLMRGRFSSVLPSTILKPGAFARRGVPATKNYASSGKKARLAAIGSRHGCHTCGKRWTAKTFIADHQPPLSLPKRTGIMQTLTKVFQPHRPEYRFYPQCTACSKVQMCYLSAIGVQRNGALAPGKAVRVDFNHIVTHASSLRVYHLYLPFPILLAAMYSFCAG